MPPRLLATLFVPPPTLPARYALLPQSSTRTIRSIDRNRKATKLNDPSANTTLGVSHAAALARRAGTTPLRTGVMGIKKGMSAMYDPETGARRAVTIVQLDRNQVVAHKMLDPHGYWAVQVGLGFRQARNVSRAMLGHYAMAEVSPKRELHEFKVKDSDGLLEIGSTVGAAWFKEGDFVDAKADCHGKGFAGVMKRHGMKGQPASHGVSLTHRSMGSAGQSQGGGSRVYPGKRMAGRMGGQQVTVKNVRILKVDVENQLLILNGKFTRAGVDSSC